MKTFFWTLLLLASYGSTAFAGEFQIFGIRTDFQLSDDQPRFRDVYINMGTSQGIKTGSSLDVYRSVTTVDELNQKTGRNISFKIAKLKVIHADTDISVARVTTFLSPETTPIGTYTNVIVGDQVEVSGK
jgi:hypothetical protein